MGTGAPLYKGFRFPAEIISHCVWLYYRFTLSFREVEEMMLARGVTVSHETIRQWTGKFGQVYANGLRRRRPRPGDKWHLDEVFIKINGKTHYLCVRLTRAAATGLPRRDKRICHAAPAADEQPGQGRGNPRLAPSDHGAGAATGRGKATVSPKRSGVPGGAAAPAPMGCVA